MNTQQIIELSDQYLMNTYKRAPVAFVRGEGCYLFDAEGKKYLDFLAGIATNGLGHSHPKITEIVCKQAATLIHTSNLFYVKSQAELAKMLCDHSFADQAFICNSGAEANETMVKLARKYQKKNKGEGCSEIITMEKSFHGRTLGMIAATGQPRVKQDFEPIPSGFVHIPYDDIAALEKQTTPKTCAVLLEPVQGEGGVRFPKEGYLREVRRICDANKALLLFDEVQTGLGRTGKLFSYEHSGIEPDALTLAKSLGTGIPIGACIARKEVSQVFEPGDHASTFGGNFLVCEAAKAFLAMLTEGDLLQRVQRMGAYFLAALQKLKNKYPFILEVRGKGLMIGASLSKPGKDFVEEALKRGLIINCTQETVLRFVPPMILTEKEVDEGMAILDQVFQDVGGK